MITYFVRNFNVKELFKIFLLFITIVSSSALALTDATVNANTSNQQSTAPYFTAMVNCVRVNQNGTFTAFFGYRNDGPEVKLSESRISPSSLEQNQTNTLKSGRHEHVFSVTSTSLNQNIVWSIKVYGKGKTATASKQATPCKDDVRVAPVDDSNEESPDTENPSDNSGTTSNSTIQGEKGVYDDRCLKSWCPIPLPTVKVHDSLRKVIDQADQNEIIPVSIILTKQANLSEVYNITDWNERGKVAHQKLLQVANETQPDLVNLITEWQKTDGNLTYSQLYVINAITIQSTKENIVKYIEELEFSRSDVAHIEYIPQIVEHEYDYSALAVNADDVHGSGNQGSNVVIGVIDSGVRYTHESLVNSYRGNNGDGTFSHDYNWFDYGFQNQSPAYCSPHGTGVTSVVSSSISPTSPGNTGIAPGSKWIGSRNLCPGQSANSTYLSMQFMFAPHPSGQNPFTTSDPSKRPNIVNNSWGITRVSLDYNNWTTYGIINSWRAANILPVFSIGNTGPGASTAEIPGSFDLSFGVGATDQANTVADFSSRGPSLDSPNSIKPDVVAPGVSMKVANIDDDSSYRLVSGTSFAAPIVSGCAALLLNQNPNLTVYELENRIKRSATDLGAIGPDFDYGHGLVNCEKALQINDSNENSTSIYGRVWEDFNGDSLLTFDESRYFGLNSRAPFSITTVTIQLLNTDNIVLAETVPNNHGHFSFTNLVRGKEYKIKVALSPNREFVDIKNAPIDSGFTYQSNSNVDPITGESDFFIFQGESVYPINVGITGLGSFYGTVFIDENRNGLRDRDRRTFDFIEDTVGELTLNLYEVQGDELKFVSTTTTVPSPQRGYNHLYRFLDLPIDTFYVIELQNDPRWGISTYLEPNLSNRWQNNDFKSENRRTNPVYPLTAYDDTGVREGWIDAGVYPIQPGTINGLAWIDENFNGFRDENEINSPVSTTFELLTDNNELIATVQSDPITGTYSFTNVYPGNYKIKAVVPEFFLISPADSTVLDQTRNSDFNSIDGFSSNVTITEGLVISNLDVGIVQAKLDINSTLTADNNNPSVGDNVAYTIKVTNTINPENVGEINLENVNLLLNPEFFNHQELVNISFDSENCCSFDTTDPLRPVISIDRLTSGESKTISLITKIRDGSQGVTFQSGIKDVTFTATIPQSNLSNNISQGVEIVVQDIPVLPLLRGNAFEDVNANGQRDGDENDANAVLVQLIGPDESVLTEFYFGGQGWQYQPEVMPTKLRYTQLPPYYKVSGHLVNGIASEASYNSGIFEVPLTLDSNIIDSEDIVFEVGITLENPCLPGANLEGDYCVLPPTVTSKECPEGFGIVSPNGNCELKTQRCPEGYSPIYENVCQKDIGKPLCNPGYTYTENATCLTTIESYCPIGYLIYPDGTCKQTTPKICPEGYVFENGACTLYAMKYYTPTFNYALCDERRGPDFYITDLRGIEGNPLSLDCSYGGNRYRTIPRTGSVQLFPNGTLCIFPQTPSDFGSQGGGLCSSGWQTTLVTSFCQQPNLQWMNVLELNYGIGKVPQCPERFIQDDVIRNFIESREGATLVSEIPFPGAVELRYPTTSISTVCPSGYFELDAQTCFIQTSRVCPNGFVNDLNNTCTYTVLANCPLGTALSGNSCLDTRFMSCPPGTTQTGTNQCSVFAPSICPIGFSPQPDQPQLCQQENKSLAPFKLITPESLASSCADDDFSEVLQPSQGEYRCTIDLQGRLSDEVEYVLPASYQFEFSNDSRSGVCSIENTSLNCTKLLQSTETADVSLILRNETRILGRISLP